MVEVYQGDCLDVLPTLDSCSVDSVVTDPPYGLEFMGKEWDHGVPGIPFWKAAIEGKFGFIGIEKNEEYTAIAMRRLREEKCHAEG